MKKTILWVLSSFALVLFWSMAALPIAIQPETLPFAYWLLLALFATFFIPTAYRPNFARKYFVALRWINRTFAGLLGYLVFVWVAFFGYGRNNEDLESFIVTSVFLVAIGLFLGWGHWKR
ncbi:MAG: hypothetical protein AAFX45_06190 [Pseudomonadota bacterium]